MKMADIAGMFKGAGQLHENLVNAQSELLKVTVTGEAGGGQVRVSVNGMGEIISVQLQPEALTDVEMLQELMVAAGNEAIRRARQEAQQRLGAMFGMANLPMLGALGGQGSPDSCS